MSDKKISQLTAATTPLDGTEVLPLVQSGATKKVANNDLRPKQIQSNATSGVLQVVGPAAASTRVMTTPDANFTVARTDAAQTFTGTQTFNGSITKVNQVAGTSGSPNYDVIAQYFLNANRWQLRGYNIAQNLDTRTWPAITATLDDGSQSEMMVWHPYDGVSTSSNFTASGSVKTDGLVSHAGTGGAYNSNKFNLQWTGSPILWVDAVNLGTISLTSDYRVKKSVKTQTEKAIPKIMKLRPVTYEFKDYGNLFVADGIKREGFIAHEVQEVIPSGAEGVKDAKDRIQNLRTDAILSVAVKAIQEQQLQIEQLIAEIATLKGAV